MGDNPSDEVAGERTSTTGKGNLGPDSDGQLAQRRRDTRNTRGNWCERDSITDFLGGDYA